jgi:hypothetical protein
MAEQIRTIHVGDTRTVLSVALSQKNAAGVDTVVDLTGLTVEFKLVNESGVEVIAQTGTGVTVTTAATGEVQYDFLSAGVAAPGRYYGYFVAIDTTETDHFPVVARELVICIEGDA